MTRRILPPSEWAKLAGTPLGDVWHLLPTSGLIIVVVEDADGQIVAHHTWFQAWHGEQLWVAPSHRKRGAVFGHLVAAMRELLTGYGAKGFITHAESDEVTTLVGHLGGTRLPGFAYSVPVDKEG